MLKVCITQRALLHSDRGYCSPLDVFEEPRLLRCTDGAYRKFTAEEVISPAEFLQLTDGTVFGVGLDSSFLTREKVWKPLRNLQKKDSLHKMYPDNSFYVAPFTSVYNLEDVTYSGSGTFSIRSKAFAELSGRFVRSTKRLKNGKIKISKPSGQCTSLLRDYPEVIELVDKKNTYLLDTWFVELLESFYGDADDTHYIPDEIVFTAPNAWLTAFMEGLKAKNKKDAMRQIDNLDLSHAITNILLRLGTSAQFIRLDGVNIALLNVKDTSQSIHLGEEIAQTNAFILTTDTGIPNNVGLWVSGYGIKN